MSEYVRAYEGNEPYIFVSYAHKDSEKVLPVIRQLYERKYRVWYDEGINPATEWPKNIARHLQNAAAVLVFVSENSLSSPNCRNEMITAKENKKIILVGIDGIEVHSLINKEKYKLDDNLLNKLAGQEEYELDENIIKELENNIGCEYIGDGITGYEYSIEKKKSFNTWNLMLGLAVALAIVFSYYLYGLYNGRYDDLLPAKQPVIEVVAPTAEPIEAVSIDSNLIGSVLPVSFTSNEEKDAVYVMLGWDQPNEMTYKDLMRMDWVTRLEICNESIKDVSFAAYLPNLEVIALSGSWITDFTPLVECPKLKTVQVSADMLPVTLPTVRAFEVEVI